MYVSDLLNSALEARRMTGSELARQLGVARQTVSHWRRGRWPPEMQHLLSIWRVLEVPEPDQREWLDAAVGGGE